MRFFNIYFINNGFIEKWLTCGNDRHFTGLAVTDSAMHRRTLNFWRENGHKG